MVVDNLARPNLLRTYFLNLFKEDISFEKKKLQHYQVEKVWQYLASLMEMKEIS